MSDTLDNSNIKANALVHFTSESTGSTDTASDFIDSTRGMSICAMWDHFSFVLAIFEEFTELTGDSTGLIYHSSQYGITMIVPEGAMKEKASIRIGVCLLSQNFKFPDDFVPVSPIVYVHISCQLIKPAEIYVPHHIDVSNMSCPYHQLYLLKANDDSFIMDNVFAFKQTNEYKINIQSRLVKIYGTHFCSLCCAVNKLEYDKIPKQYLIIRADKTLNEGHTLLVDFCLLYRQKICKEVT